MTMLRRLLPGALLALALIANGPEARAAGTSYEGLWGNPAEPGSGVSLTQQGSTIVAVWLIYGQDGTPWWVIGVLDPLDGGANFTGPIYKTTGTPYTAPAFSKNDTHEELVGAATAAFDGANRLTLSYRINDVDNVKSLERQTFVAVDLTGAYYGSIKDANSFAQAQISIGTGPDGAFLMEQRVGFSDVCEMSGTYRQLGSRYEASGTFECADSRTGTFATEDLTRVDSVFVVGTVTMTGSGAVETRELMGRLGEDSNTGSALSGLEAQYRSGFVDVTWHDGLFCRPVPNTEIWRATADNVADAQRVGFVMGLFYADRTIAAGATYYYWIRANCGGHTGPFVPSSGGVKVVVP